MNRDDIECQDFPSARRGYDAAAVREHLRRVADEFEALAARPRAASIAEDASAHVRAILEAAESSARELRDDAARAASDHVERVAEGARELLVKLDIAHAELDRLLAGLKSSAATLAGSLGDLSDDVGALRAVAGAASTEPAIAADERDEPADAAPNEPEPAINGAVFTDEAGARLVALNMALEGAPREETGRYLAEHFELGDVESLLDDVYTSAGR